MSGQGRTRSYGASAPLLRHSADALRHGRAAPGGPGRGRRATAARSGGRVRLCSAGPGGAELVVFGADDGTAGDVESEVRA